MRAQKATDDDVLWLLFCLRHVIIFFTVSNYAVSNYSQLFCLCCGQKFLKHFSLSAQSLNKGLS